MENTEIDALKENSKQKKAPEDFFCNQEIIHYSSENKFYLYIIKEIVSNYLDNRTYGLNIYLGTRIRHIYCQQLLFSVFEKRNLLSRKEKDDSMVYMINEYWNQHILDDNERNKVLKLLDNFSKNMNNMLQRLKNDFIQIKNENKAEGWFDYTGVAKKILDYTLIVRNSPEIVFYTVVDELNKHTINLLSNIRNKLQNELEDFCRNELEQLRNRLYNGKISENIVKELLFHVQKCEEELPAAIVNFQNIFYFENFSYPDFIIKNVIDCNIAIYNKMYADMKEENIKCEITMNKTIAGKFFPDWIDIIGILFQNVREHSGYMHLSDANFAIIISVKNIGQKEWVSIRTGNKFDDWTGIRMKEIDAKITERINNIRQNRILEGSMGERGSGIYTIARILKYNFGVEADFSCEVKAGEFILEIDFPIENMVVK